MSNRLHFLVALFYISIFGLLSAATPQYENQQVEKVDIIVENSRNSSAISSVKSRITICEGGFFSQADFDNDLKLLARDFDRVEPELRSINGKMHIILKVWPKPQIRSIQWCGNHHIKTDDLRKELAVNCLTTFDRLAFNKAFHKVKAYFVKNGFFEAQLNYEVVIDEETNEADIVITVVEGRVGHINKLIFCGFTKCEESEILDLIITKTYNMFFSWYTGEGTYQEDAIQQDQFVILNYIQNKGFADAKVEFEIKETCNNRIDIHIKLCRGELYTVSNINFTGNKLFCDDLIRAEFTFSTGDPYSPEDIRETLGNISNLYGRKGYIDANVDFDPSLDPQTLSYAIDMTIEEGQQFRVGLIKVFGNSTTQTGIILHESLLIPGAIFNIEKLKLTEQKLTNVGFFETVNVYAVKSDGPLGLGENYRDVHIEVKETSTGHFGAFFGYSTAESVFGGVNITERNFNYQGLKNLRRDGWGALRGGGEYAHATVQVGMKSRKYILSWAKPFFRDSQWTVGFDLERNNNRYISDDYEINSTALIVHATYNINQFVSFGWHYRIKNSDVDVSQLHHHNRKNDDHGDKNGKHQKNKSKQKGGNSEDSETPIAKGQKTKGRHELSDDAKLAGLISASGISLTYDSTNHPVTPSAGFKSRFEFEYAGIGGDHTYFGLGYLNSYFIPLDKKSVVKFRADLRFILPFGNTTPHKVPLDERFFLGGDALVRGYRSYRLGPLYSGTDDPRGGISQQYYSVEVTRRFHPKLEAFTYLDAGYLSFRRMRVGTPYYSVGVGARVKIIESIPSLTFGYGIPINPKSNNQVKRFFISIGGQF
ncbi:MAG: outer membrane protein assembly factor BamA [Parachlamydiaceae bacterium]|nr:outer membrane protein assembly factor BamA [Parachlamydiaceae bacterium]